jgi:hypothetical protein
VSGAVRLQVRLAAGTGDAAAVAAGADGITIPVGEAGTGPAPRPALPVTIEAPPDEVDLALRHRPDAVLLLAGDAAARFDGLRRAAALLSAAGIRAILGVAPEPRQVDAAIRLGVPAILLDTSGYAGLDGEAGAAALRRIEDAAALAAKNGIAAGAGGGLTLDNVVAVAAVPQIGAVTVDDPSAGDIRALRALIAEARGVAPSPLQGRGPERGEVNAMQSVVTPPLPSPLRGSSLSPEGERSA